MAKCRKCQKEFSTKFTSCPFCARELGIYNFKAINEREKWELRRDKICLAFYLIFLTGFCLVSCYILINAANFPKEIGLGVVTIMSLVILTFVGQITRTPSIKRAVASAIEQLLLRISTRNIKPVKRNKKMTTNI